MRSVAYLVSRYPAYSHGFIDAEICGMRELGWSVSTYSINRPEIPQHPDHGTTASFFGARRHMVVWKVAYVVARNPLVILGLLGTSLKLGMRRQPSWSSLLRHSAYFVEAAYFYEILRRTAARHIHVHFANNAADVAHLVVLLGNRVAKIGEEPWSWSLAIHGPTDFADSHRNGIREKVGQADLVTCISHYARSVIRDLTGSRREVEIVRMGVVAPLSGDLETQTRDQDSPLRILFVGRLVDKKGPDVLLRAVEKAASNYPEVFPNVELVVIGDGPLRERLEEIARETSSNISVRFLGAVYQRDVLTWYKWADVLCLPSYSEGLPVVLMEAMIRGVAVVTTPIAGVPELVENGESGLLVSAGSVDELVEALYNLRTKEELRRRVEAGGRDRVSNWYLASGNAAVLGRLISQCRPPSDGHVGVE